MRKLFRGLLIAFGQVIAVIAGCIVIVAAIFLWLDQKLTTVSVEQIQQHLPRNVRPAEIIIQSNKRRGLIEGCGVSVLRLEKGVTDSIRSGALEYLNTLVNDEGSRQLKPWQPTPVGRNDIYDAPSPGAFGLERDCSPRFSEEERRRFWSLLNLPGSYWTIGPELLLIIEPNAEVMILSGNG